MDSRLRSGLSWLVALLIPLAIVMFSVRVLMTPLFLQIEYRMPGFPADPYGFSMQDRLRWATPSLDYLLNSAGIDYLAQLQFDDGGFIYNSRELSHMHDVKGVVQMLLRTWDMDLGLLLLLGIWAWRGNWLDDYRRGWRYGGILTIVLLVFILTFAATSFWQFFSWFHSLFFSGNSWLFAYSDTLIRLFPIRFWEDCFAYVGVISVLLSLLAWFGLKPRKTVIG